MRARRLRSPAHPHRSGHGYQSGEQEIFDLDPGQHRVQPVPQLIQQAVAEQEHSPSAMPASALWEIGGLAVDAEANPRRWVTWHPLGSTVSDRWALEGRLLRDHRHQGRL